MSEKNIIPIKCSNCKKNIAELWITDESHPAKSKVVVNCAYCGDKSYAKQISGKFYIGSPADDKVLIAEQELDDCEFDENGQIKKQTIKITTRLA